MIWTLTVSGGVEMINILCSEGIQQGVLVEEVRGWGAKGKKKSKGPLKAS